METHPAPAPKEPIDFMPEIAPVDPTPDALAIFPAAHSGSRTRGVPWFWLVALALVVGFGYLSDRRRAGLEAFVNQVGDVAHDFRGYDPEV